MALIVQYIFQLPLRYIYKLFYELSFEGQEHTRNLSKPLLIIGNHKSINDPWFIGSSLPAFSPLLPVRYIAGTRFDEPLQSLYRLKIISFIYWIFGAIALPSEGDRAAKIQPIIGTIQQNDTVVMFPEGRRVFENIIGEFKTGSAEVIMKTHATVLPVACRTILDKNRKRLVVKFGPAFHPQGTTIDEITSELKNAITQLYASIKK